METEKGKQRPPHSQLISVPPKDTVRLLEVYVKRSLSLNDGTHRLKVAGRKEKWVTVPKKPRRHSSDPSFHLAPSLENVNGKEIDAFDPVEHVTNQPEKCPEEPEKPTKKSKKIKKTSFWKNILGFFTRKDNEDKDEEQDSPQDMSNSSENITTCLPITPVTLPKRSTKKRSLRRRFSKRQLPVIKPNKPADITGVEAVVSVKPTDYYYEKVSEELEKIVHEVKEVKEKEEVPPLSDEEVINRIIALMKEQGDAIDLKMKDNPTVSCFFQQMTYSSFQKLADAYVDKEGSSTQKPPTVLPTAPELVKLAFTLDFTARIARLSKQNVGHITGLGDRYLQDRFEYRQACTDHPWSDSDD